MSDPYIEFRKNENIRPLELLDKGKYYRAIANIDHSFSGRIGTVINTFIMEAAQQLVNSIELFEMGYFDCAYYSLRSAVDVSTTMVFLTDMPDADRDKYLEDWKDTKHFPMQGQLLKMLSDNGYVFSDMKEKMPSFFNDAKELSQELNKYVHKQGLRHFYVSRNHTINKQKSQEVFINTFEYYLKKCIGVVAVMRLAGDPFPILLMDEDFLLRCFDSMTEAYSEAFVNEYIGESVISDYKNTDIYQGTYKAFINDEKRNHATFNVMKYWIIDRSEMSDILSQIHLLNRADVVAVLMVNACSKIAKAYAYDGMMIFHTELATNRKEMSWDMRVFRAFSENANKYNQPFDEAYISVFECLGENYFAEHNEILTEEEIANIKDSIYKYSRSKKG